MNVCSQKRILWNVCNLKVSVLSISVISGFRVNQITWITLLGARGCIAWFHQALSSFWLFNHFASNGKLGNPLPLHSPSPGNKARQLVYSHTLVWQFISVLCFVMICTSVSKRWTTMDGSSFSTTIVKLYSWFFLSDLQLMSSRYLSSLVPRFSLF